jgi:hypothetical protein
VRSLRAVVLTGFAVMLVVALAPQATKACELCHVFFDDESCKTATPGESGFTKCTVPEEASCCCTLSGNACTGGSGGGGGGGGGTGGGGGNPCQTTGFCPAQCFSCGGGGFDRPAF